MNILFIHNNFPGQFGPLSASLAAQPEHRVVFMTQSENRQKIRIQGVEMVRFTSGTQSLGAANPYVQPLEGAVFRAQAVFQSLLQLRNAGFVPDIVIIHAGYGFGFFIKSLFSRVRMISLVEWWLRPETAVDIEGTSSIEDCLRLDSLNLSLLQEILKSDQVVCPTQWQKDQFPQELQEKIVVQFDGIDCSLFAPQKTQEPFFLSGEDTQAPLVFSSDQLLLTYGTRGMEPLRDSLSSCGRQPLPSSASHSCMLWSLAATALLIPIQVVIPVVAGSRLCWMNLMVSSTWSVCIFQA